MTCLRYHSTISLPRVLLQIVALALLLGHGERILADPANHTNIIMIMADDLGYETIGANGGTSYPTPHLDRLATAGTRFEHCYVQPLCTPTRCQLMTGQYNVRNYIRFGLLHPQAITFGNLLKRAGYATCITGKWQLGEAIDAPQKFGFDESYLWQHTRRPPRYANPGLEDNGTPKDFNNGEYGPDLVNDYALDFITRNQSRPFFLYYPMILTHSPYQPTPDSPTWDPKAVGEKVHQSPKHFGEMVTYMDKLIGKLIDRLEQEKLAENTLVLFVGDNGTGKGTKSQMGAKEIIGGKGTTTARGMHVPLIAWGASVKRGQVRSELVDSTDFLPTILDAASVQRPRDLQLDGQSFLPQCRGEQGTPRSWIYSWYSPRQGTDKTIREFAFNQHYKLYRNGDFFDLNQDRDEKSPLAVKDLDGPSLAAAKQLQAALDQYVHARPADLDDGLSAGDATESKKRPNRKAAKQQQANAK